ncbi:MAG TPA: site-specific integrase [Chitinophagales bacterium]|nr:site-specific integrase [Chitinophagales bacterium]
MAKSTPKTTHPTANPRLNETATYKIIMRDYSKNDDGNAPLLFQIFINKDRWRTPVGVYIKPTEFNKATGKVTIKHKDHRSLNLVLGRALAKANGILVDFRLSDRPITMDAFKNEYTRGEKKYDFVALFEKMLSKRKTELDEITYRCHRSMLKKLKAFSPSINIHDLKPAMFDDMKDFMKQRGNNKFTQWSFFKVIKTYINLARRDGLLIQNPFKGYPVRPPKSTRNFLDEKEVATLYHHYLSPHCHSTHRKVLQYFLFSCFTGLRISDISRLQHDHLINQQLHFVAKKNRTDNKRITIPLPDEAMQFITSTQGPLFTTISDQKTNKALKEIAVVCKIKKRLTYHVSRHTYGYLLVKRGVNPAVVKELMGHENINTTMIYVHINDQQKLDGATRLNGLLQTAD